MNTNEVKLNTKRTILIGFAFMAILAFWQFYDQVIPYVLEVKFGLGTLSANAVMAIDNVLAIFMLPLFGRISDRTHTRLGKRTPYILFGTVASVLLMLPLAYFIDVKTRFLPFFIVLVALLVVMAIYRSPAVAYMPDVTEKPLRSKANAIVNLVGYLGGIFATVLMMVLLHKKKGEFTASGVAEYAENQKFAPTILILAGFMLVAVLIMVFSLNENKIVAETNIEDDDEETVSGGKLERSVRRSMILILSAVFCWYAAYNAVTTAFSRYCVKIWKVDLGASSGYLLIATVAAIASFIPLGFLSGKVGRKKTVLVGVAMMIVGYGVAFFLTKPSVLMYVVFAVVGIGWAAINVNSFPMVVEMCSGADIGKYTGYYYTFSMAAQIATPLLSGLLIDRVGYRVLFPYAVALSVLALVIMLFVKHGDAKPLNKKSILEHFDVDD
ncbi:MAG: MFS transporter [Clostridia bacterium]|nr:MFS transporter [Clostridia bacterium]